MAHGTMLPEQESRLQELCSVAAEMTDPERGLRKNPRAIVKITFYDGYPREFSLELAEKTIVKDELKRKNPGT